MAAIRTKSRTNGALQTIEPPMPASDAAAILSIIERIASDPAADIEKVERLMAMRREELARQAQIAFAVAMKAAQAAMPQVVKDAENDSTKSRYAKYETISEAMQPVIDQHGFALTFGEGDTPKPNHIRIVCDVMHVEGHIRAYHVDVPIDAAGFKGTPNKTATHAFGSTTSYGKRYLKLMIFDVATRGDDTDGSQSSDAPADNGLISKQQADTIRDLIKTKKVNLARFCNWLHVRVISDIPAAQHQRAVDALNGYQTDKARG